METNEIKRVNVNLPNDLIDQVDSYAARMNINRTSAICVLLSQALKQEEVISRFPDMLNLLKDAKDKGLFQ